MVPVPPLPLPLPLSSKQDVDTLNSQISCPFFSRLLLYPIRTKIYGSREKCKTYRQALSHGSNNTRAWYLTVSSIQQQKGDGDSLSRENEDKAFYFVVHFLSPVDFPAMTFTTHGEALSTASATACLRTGNTCVAVPPPPSPPPAAAAAAGCVGGHIIHSEKTRARWASKGYQRKGRARGVGCC